ncbi:DUF559 domain-containing protein [Anaerobacterium chartisolvens]|uniref:DUF559 domain-containing protein n=1 Tax=Anaerobacterium chartisolvens TaxID=1297424 RepID=UPI000DF1755F
MWDKIGNKQLGGYRFLRQYAISRYIADFYCSKAKTVLLLRRPAKPTWTFFSFPSK